MQDRRSKRPRPEDSETDPPRPFVLPPRAQTPKRLRNYGDRRQHPANFFIPPEWLHRVSTPLQVHAPIPVRLSSAPSLAQESWTNDRSHSPSRIEFPALLDYDAPPGTGSYDSENDVPIAPIETGYASQTAISPVASDNTTETTRSTNTSVSRVRTQPLEPPPLPADDSIVELVRVNPAQDVSVNSGHSAPIPVGFPPLLDVDTRPWSYGPQRDVPEGPMWNVEHIAGSSLPPHPSDDTGRTPQTRTASTSVATGNAQFAEPRPVATEEMDVTFPELDRPSTADGMIVDSPNLSSQRHTEDGAIFEGIFDSARSSSHPGISPSNSQGGVQQRNRYRLRDRAYPPMVIGFNNAHNRRKKDQETRNLHASVRQMMKEELGFAAGQELPHPPASIDDIANFLNGGQGPSLDFLQLDLVTTSDGVRSHWNIAAAAEFADAFLARVHDAFFDEDAFKDEDLTPLKIKALFLTKIRYFAQLYRKMYFPVPSAIRKRRKQWDRKTSRRLSLYRLRGRVSSNNEDLRSFFERVDDELISEDETDVELSIRAGLKVFRRIEKGWVNPEVTRIFHDVIDVHHQRLDLFGEFGAGNQFRQRVNHPPKRVTWTGVVVGLPANVYNPSWLERLTHDEREALDVQPPVDLQGFATRHRRRCCEGRPQREGSPLIVL